MDIDMQLFKEGKAAWGMVGVALVWSTEISVESESLLGSLLAEALAGTFDAHPNHGLLRRNALGAMAPFSGDELRDLCEATAGLADFERRAASVRDWWSSDAPGLPPPSPEPKPPSRLQIAAEARRMSEELALTVDAVMAFATKKGFPLPTCCHGGKSAHPAHILKNAVSAEARPAALASAPQPKPPAPPQKRPTETELRDIIRRCYPDGKMPGIAQAETAIRDAVRDEGFQPVYGNGIRNALEEPEFAAMRKRPGRPRTA